MNNRLDNAELQCFARNLSSLTSYALKMGYSVFRDGKDVNLNAEQFSTLLGGRDPVMAECFDAWLSACRGLTDHVQSRTES